MIRIFVLSLLTLTLSCANTRPETPETPPQEQTEAADTLQGQTLAQAPLEEPKKPAPTPRKTKRPARGPKKPARNAETPTHDTEKPEPEINWVPAPMPVEEQPVPAVAEPVPAETPAEPLQQPVISVLPIPDAAASEKRFLPTRKRIDREVDKLKFAYKGEVMMGITASYGTLSSDDTDFMLIIDNINASGTIATVKPFIGYFYRDNNCIGVRFGYNHVGGTVNSLDFDLGESNDASFEMPYLDLTSDNYSFGIFHRSYAGLDPKGRFGLFAEFELAFSTGSSDFAYESGAAIKRTYSDNTQVKLSFNPGAAVYIFPNVCATLSFGLGGVQYTSVTQKDAEGNKIGTRKSSNMKFKLNIAAINIGMTIHLWDKKKQ